MEKKKRTEISKQYLLWGIYMSLMNESHLYPSETCHDPRIYQIFLSDFQLVMSFTSFSLNSLHAGSRLCILELQMVVMEGIPFRRSHHQKRVFHSKGLNSKVWLPWGADTGHILLLRAEMGCVRMCVESILNLFEQRL